MRLFSLVFGLLAVSNCCCTFESDELDGFSYNELYNPDFEVRNLADPLGMPKTAAEMVARFNADFMTFLTSRNPQTWNRLMEVMDQGAYIETCMEAYSLKMDQFHKWMTYLGKYYLEVGVSWIVLGEASQMSLVDKFRDNWSVVLDCQHWIDLPNGSQRWNEGSWQVVDDCGVRQRQGLLCGECPAHAQRV